MAFPRVKLADKIPPQEKLEYTFCSPKPQLFKRSSSHLFIVVPVKRPYL